MNSYLNLQHLIADLIWADIEMLIRFVLKHWKEEYFSFFEAFV